MNKKLIIFTVIGFIVGGLIGAFVLNEAVIKTAIKEAGMEGSELHGGACSYQIGGGLRRTSNKDIIIKKPSKACMALLGFNPF